MKYTAWERAYFRIRGYWPQSVVQRRIAEYEEGVLKKRAEHDKRMQELRDNPPPLVPDGIYRLKVMEGDIINTASGRQALRLRAEIVEDPEHNGHELWSYLVYDHPPASFVWEEAWPNIDMEKIVGSVRPAEIRTDEYMGLHMNRVFRWLPSWES